MALYFPRLLQAICVVNLVALVSRVRSLTGVPSQQKLWFNHNHNGIGNFNHQVTQNLSSYNAFREILHNTTMGCNMDRSKPPDLEELVGCQNSSMFHIWRPKARLIAPRGWMNDPTAIFETKNGAFHVGYECSPDHLGWANISQCAASTKDFVHFEDYRSWKDPVTLAPTQIYDIRGVFDGVVIKDGWNGNPSLLYTSTYVGPFGPRSDPPEVEGAETQSIAYTEDDGNTWTKLNFGENGNPVIYYWPERNLSGFRDPSVFESPEFSKFYANTTIEHHLPASSNGIKPVGDKYLTLSGGIRTEADPVNGGPRLFLYRQTEKNNIRDWTYLGPILSFAAERNQTSEWRGGNGINFETGSFSIIKEKRSAEHPSSSPSTHQLNIFTIGTDGGRNLSHNNLWPVWLAVNWDFNSPDGNVKGKLDFSGVVDWGRAYAFTQFPVGERQFIVGWAYEDDDFDVLTQQRGVSGALTLFREVFVKVVHNIHPNALMVPEKGPSWTIKKEDDGSYSLITLGQSIASEIQAAFRKHSEVTKIRGRTINLESVSMDGDQGGNSTKLVPFETQPKERYHVINAQLDFFPQQNIPLGSQIHRPTSLSAGFRVLSGRYEWTDVYYDPNEEQLVIDRSHSSSIPSYGNSTEVAKHRLWPIMDPSTNQTTWQSLNLTIVVDGSILEVHANECAIITTRVYPWCEDSTEVNFLVHGPRTHAGEEDPATGAALEDGSELEAQSVRFSRVELWDGLLNAWPNRPQNTYLPGVYNNNITSTVFGLWPDV